MEETWGNEEINIAIDVHDDNVAGGNDAIEGYQLVDDAEHDSIMNQTMTVMGN